MGQFGAPGTTVVITGAVVACGDGPAVARGVAELAGAASRAVSRTLRCALAVDEAPQPAMKTAVTAITTPRRTI
jgi:hypothetical protein